MSDLPAGRELDALVAENVMGWRCTDPLKVVWLDAEDYVRDLPGFSTTWDGMRLVVERMRELGWMYAMDAVDCVGGWAVWMGGESGRVRQEGDTLPHAVCLAALAAIASNSKEGV